jgi:hypothetical protein
MDNYSKTTIDLFNAGKYSELKTYIKHQEDYVRDKIFEKDMTLFINLIKDSKVLLNYKLGDTLNYRAEKSYGLSGSRERPPKRCGQIQRAISGYGYHFSVKGKDEKFSEEVWISDLF